MLSRAKVLARQGLIHAMYGPKLPAFMQPREARPVPSPHRIKRVVVVRPDHLGDLLFATPALERLRAAFPDLFITGLVGPWGRAMWEHNRNLDSIATVPFPGLATRKTGGPLKPYLLLGRVARHIQEREYDLGIVLRFDHWWGAALLQIAGVPYRWGYGTPGMGAWLTHTVPYLHGRHEVEQDLVLMERVIQFMYKGSSVQRVGPLVIDRQAGEPPLHPPRPSPPTHEVVQGWLDAPRRAVIHPGTAAANKLWTIEGWASVIHKLAHEGWTIALTGSPAERPLADAIQAATSGLGTECPPGDGAPLHNLAGQTADIHQLAWVLKHAHIVLGVDSGPLHIAAALGRPTLHLYGPSDERIWGPWGDPRLHTVLRAPGTHPTMRLEVGSPELEGGPEMRAITPEMVMHEVDELMREV